MTFVDVDLEGRRPSGDRRRAMDTALAAKSLLGRAVDTSFRQGAISGTSAPPAADNVLARGSSWPSGGSDKIRGCSRATRCSTLRRVARAPGARRAHALGLPPLGG